MTTSFHAALAVATTPAERLAAIMLKGESQRAFAERIGIAQSAVSVVLSGKRDDLDLDTWRTEGRGDSLSVTAHATMADTGEVVEATVSMAMAKAEGWTKNAKYQSLPEQMLKYRAATFLIRLYCPEVMLGYPAVDEIEDIAAAAPPVHAGPARVIDPEADPFEREADEVVEVAPAPLDVSDLADRANAAATGGTDSYRAFWTSLTKAEREAIMDGHDARKAAAAAADAGDFPGDR